jgi:hypothetical protein
MEKVPMTYNLPFDDVKTKVNMSKSGKANTNFERGLGMEVWEGERAIECKPIRRG